MNSLGFLFNARRMRVPVYLVCAALVVAVRSEEQQGGGSTYYASGNDNNNNNRFLEPLDVVPDRETVSYLLPKLAAKYRPNSEWSGVTDPRFYLLTEMESNDIDNQAPLPRKRRVQRRSPTISITAPIDVLRKSWEQERTRKQMKANRDFLSRLN